MLRLIGALLLVVGCGSSAGPTMVDPFDVDSGSGAAGADAATSATEQDASASDAAAVHAAMDAASGEPDGSIPCEQFSSTDDDDDGVVNGCDVCPMGDDADDDQNGYPDACDTVMWSYRLRAPNDAAIKDALARLQVIEPDGKPSRIFAEQTFNLAAEDAASFDITSEAIADLVEDALTPLSATDTPRRLRVSLAWNLGAGSAEHAQDLALVQENVITRVRVHGSITASEADVTFELRGYRGFQ